jgi:hypothetical protein
MLNHNNYITTFFINSNGSSFYSLSTYCLIDSVVVSDILYTPLIEDMDYDELYVNDEYNTLLSKKINSYHDICKHHALSNSAFQFISVELKHDLDIDAFTDDCFNL